MKERQETIVHDDVRPVWFCRCEGPDGMVAHPLDERRCPVCGDDLDRILKARASK